MPQRKSRQLTLLFLFYNMNTKILYAFLITIFVSATVLGQEGKSSSKTRRPRVIITDNLPTPTPTPRRVVIVPSATPFTKTPVTTPTPKARYTPPSRPAQQSRLLRLNEIKSKIEEAKRHMRVKPLRTSMSDSMQTTSVVRIAFHDWKTGLLDYVVLSKPSFLSRKYDIVARSEKGQTVRVKTIRGNGVNTPVMVFDIYNRAQVPLIVQYPIEKYGRFREMAYYVSTHPGIVTPETVTAGRIYVRSIIDIARQRLRQKGIFIQPKVADIAERLALVEHVDHSRFRSEYHPRIFNDVYMLYALNQGRTYRYSVSRAGAGGMVQMIPATYRMMRSRYYRVGLIPDFVRGMRNHANATEAMLLYMQMTWNDLAANTTIRNAISSGIATQEQIMAAGYNSNPARLPRYIRRGGAGWKSLIPRETKVYLRIYSSVERYVPMSPRTQ